jgi:DNA-binding transcriptional MerR regulator
MNEAMTIGKAAARSGLPVKTIRYYSDEGLLPPSGRSEAGYRLYTEADLVRLDLIRTLRDAGMDLETIGAVLRRRLSLEEALRLRLRALEAHITSLQHVAAAIRASLRGVPNEDDLRRLHAVTRLSNEERKAVIQNFYDRVAEGTHMDEGWKQGMVEASAPRMPDEPTKEQLDAWIELSEMVQDPSFIASMRSMAGDWTPEFDHVKYQTAAGEAIAAARAAIDAGTDPTSESALPIIEGLFRGTADASGREPDDAFRAELHAKHRDHDPRASRYWVLVGIINDTGDQMAGPTEEWDWISKAIVHHLAS